MTRNFQMQQDEAVSLCSLWVGDEMFGIDTREIREVLGERAIQAVPLAPDFVRGAVTYRGDVLTVLSFRKLLGLPPVAAAENVLVLCDEQEGELFGLAVDRIDDVFQVEPAQYVENPCTLDARRKTIFAGAYKLQKRLVVLLEPELLRPLRMLELANETLLTVTEREQCAH